MHRFRPLVLFTLFVIPSICVAQTPDNDISWYKMLKGSIGSFRITMHLHKAGHSFEGFYYYDTALEPIQFSGDDTSVAGKLILGAGDEVFELSLGNGAANGSWKNTSTGKVYAVSATAFKSVIPFTYVYTSGETKLRAALPNSPQGHIQLSSVWPIGSGPIDSFLKKRIMAIHSSKTGEKEIGAYFLQQKKVFFESYKSDFKDSKTEDIKEAPFSYNYEFSSSLMIAYATPKLITMAQSFYSYTGGAHGMYGTRYYVFDLTKPRQLGLNEIVTPEGRKKLRPLLEKYFRKQNNIKAGTTLVDAGLFENKIEPNSNFFVSGKGISFCYQPYEIGPYSSGQIEIFIPLSELTALLKSQFMVLIQP